MIMDVGPTIQQVFQRNLEKVILNEFPCGDGNWRNNLKWTSDLLEKTELENASKFTNEELLELTVHEIFKRDVNWSNSVNDLIKKSIEDPTKQETNNLLKRFKTLRFVNENIDGIDKFIKEFQNLEELTLSANKIKSFDVDLLPPSLTVLELCGNAIENIDFLCTKPTKFTHLGLSYNQLTSIPDSIAPNSWDSLLSLDLSFNHLDDLAGTVCALKCVLKLRALVLQGNPLYLFMGYRGYVIDTLPSLTSLDDSFIFPQERYQYTGLSELEDMPINVCMMRIVVENFHSSMTPDENEPLPDEYPKTFHTYHLELESIEDNYILEREALDVEVNVLSSDSSLQHEDGKENEKHHIMDRTGIIRSNDFELHSDKNELSFDKFVISPQPKRMADYISRNITMRLMENIIVKSNEPKPEDLDEKEHLVKPAIASKSKNNLSGTSINVKSSKKNLSSSSTTINAKKSRSKVMSTPPKSPVDKKNAKEAPKRKGKTPSPKKGDKANDGLYEWSKMSTVHGQCSVVSKSLLSGASFISNACVFLATKLNEGGNNNDISQTTGNIDVGGDSLELPPQEVRRKSKPAIPIIRTPEHDDESIVNLPKCYENIKPPEADLRIELVRWVSTNQGREWINRFKIHQ